MPKEKIFISGKISGYHYYYAYQKFAKTDKYLSKLGYKVVNPMCLCQRNWSRLRCMAVCLWNLIHCDTIYMLEDWKDSRGARIEYTIACLLRKDIIFQTF